MESKTGIKLLYDVESVPYGMSITEVFELKEKSGYLFYSSRKGNKPEILDPSLEVTIVDALNNKISYDLKKKTITFTPINEKNGKS